MDVKRFKFMLMTTFNIKLDSIRFTEEGKKMILIRKEVSMADPTFDRRKELRCFEYSGEEKNQVAGGWIMSVSSDGGAVVTMSKDRLWAWNMHNGAAVLLDSAATGCDGHDAEMRVTFALPNRIVVQWQFYSKDKPNDTGGAVAIFNSDTGRALNCLKWVGTLDFAFLVLPKTSRKVFVYNRSAFVRMWDLEDGTERNVLSMPKASFVELKVNAQGDRIAVLDRPQKVHLFDCNTGQYIACLSGHYDACGSYLKYEFSPGGRLLSTGGIDTDIRVWETGSGQELGVLRHPKQVTPAFVDDHTLLATAASVAGAPDRVWSVLPGSQALLDYVNALIAAEVLPERIEPLMLSALGIDG
jgi:hypothetical protein